MGCEVGKVQGGKGWVLGLAWAPAIGDAPSLLAAIGTDKQVRVITTDGNVVATMSGHRDTVTSVCWSPYEGNWTLATGSRDGSIYFWDKSYRGRLIGSHQASTQVTCIKWAGENRVYSAGRDRVIKAWCGASGRELFELKGHGHWVNSLGLSSEYVLAGGKALSLSERYAEFKRKTGGEKLISASEDMTVMLWTQDEAGSTMKLQTRLVGHQKPIVSARFSPDGRFIASASFDKSVKIWSGISGKFLWNLRAHVGEVYVVAWGADSRLLVSGSKDSTVKLWEVATTGGGVGGKAANKGRLKEDLPGHADEVFALDWSSDGKWVASGGRDKVVKIWSN
jgi:ribosome assembly protein 4